MSLLGLVLADQTVESHRIDRLPRDIKAIAGRTRSDRRRSRPGWRSEDPAKLAHHYLQRVQRIADLLVAPQLFHETATRHHLAHLQTEDGQQGLRLVAPNLEHLAVFAQHRQRSH